MKQDEGIPEKASFSRLGSAVLERRRRPQPSRRPLVAKPKIKREEKALAPPKRKVRGCSPSLYKPPPNKQRVQRQIAAPKQTASSLRVTISLANELRSARAKSSASARILKATASELNQLLQELTGKPQLESSATLYPEDDIDALFARLSDLSIFLSDSTSSEVRHHMSSSALLDPADGDDDDSFSFSSASSF